MDKYEKKKGGGTNANKEKEGRRKLFGEHMSIWIHSNTAMYQDICSRKFSKIAVFSMSIRYHGDSYTIIIIIMV